MAIDVNNLALNNGNFFTLSRLQAEPLLKEFFNFDKFSDLRGKSRGKIIRVKEITEGNTIQFKKRQTYFDTAIKYGNEPLEGSEQQLSFETYQMEVAPYKYAMMDEQKEYTRLITGLNLDDEMREDLALKAREITFSRTMQSIFFSMCPNSTDPIRSGNINYAVMRFEIAQLQALISACAIYSGTGVDVIAAADNISHQRIMFGDDFANAANGLPNQATIGAAITNANFTAANGHGAILDNFRQAVDLARAGNRPTSSKYFEDPIEPYSTEVEEMGYLNDKYFILMPTKAFAQLRLDPEWASQTTRGVIEAKDKQPSLFRGSSFKGEVEGMIFVTDPYLDKYLFTGNGGAGTIACSFLLGAGAVAYGMAGTPQLVAKVHGYDEWTGLAYKETGGIRPLIWHSKSNPLMKNGNNPVNVPNGIIPIFTSLV